jgi:hypothetical protein
MLVLALALAKPSGLGFRREWETKLVTAFGFGLFIVALLVWAQIFPASDLSTLEALLP